jgi:peptidoglycan/LPS O-acetylase OafA/YrhL
MIKHTHINAEIPPLTGIRAVAALWVVAFHLKRLIYEAFPAFRAALTPLVSHGYMGVDLFFLLSGFILYYNYHQRIDYLNASVYWNFIVMRLARIWPVHVFILLVFLLLHSIQKMAGQTPSNPEQYTALGWISNFLMVHGWSLPINISWNVPAWSISCEWAAYLLFPFAIFILRKIPKAPRRANIIVAIIALAFTMTLCQLLKADASARWGLIRIAGEFVAGCAICDIFLKKSSSTKYWNIITPALFVALFCFNSAIFPKLGLVSYFSIPILALIILGLAHQQCFISKFLSTKPMLYGGYISYSVYMVHSLCLIIASRAYSYLPAYAIPFVSIIFILICASIIYKFVEEPSRLKMRKLILKSL